MMRMFSQQLSDKYQKTREHDRFAIYSHALIAMTGLDRTKLSTTPSNIPQVILFLLQQKNMLIDEIKYKKQHYILFY